MVIGAVAPMVNTIPSGLATLVSVCTILIAFGDQSISHCRFSGILDVEMPRHPCSTVHMMAVELRYQRHDAVLLPVTLIVVEQVPLLIIPVRSFETVV